MNPAPDLLSLDLFVDTLQLGSLSKAALKHHLSQPSASLRVRALERQLGLRLLERSPSGSTPTADGRLVGQWAVDVLAAVDRLRLGADAIKACSERSLRIASSYSIAEHLLPRWLAAMRGEVAGGRLRLDVVNSAAVFAALAEEAVELGFVECPVIPPGMASRLVARDELVIVVPISHPWASVDIVTLPMVAEERLVVREEGSGTRESFEVAIESMGVTLRPPVLELGSTASVKSAVEDGAGPAVVSALAVDAEERRGSMLVRRLDGVDLTRDLCAVWLEGHTIGEGASRLLDVSREPRPRAGRGVRSQASLPERGLDESGGDLRPEEPLGGVGDVQVHVEGGVHDHRHDGEARAPLGVKVGNSLQQAVDPVRASHEVGGLPAR